jgi:hypothetical protein
VKPEFGSQYGGPLASPDGWPRLPPSDPGETVAAFIDRAIVGDSFLQLITPLTSDRRPAPSLDGRRPADLTLAWWEREWPYKVFHRMWDDSPPRGYHRDRVYWRLVVEWFDRLRDGDLVMKGHRTDGLTPGPPAGAARTRSPRADAAYPGEVVAPDRWENPYMVLRPRAGLLEPEQWRGRPPPPGLPWYRDLTVWPAEAAPTKQKAQPRVPHPKLLHWWTEVYLPKYPNPDKRPNADTQRTDAAAAFPDHSPPTERTMQTLRAAKGTPPEWREVGRRPNSD